MIHEIKDVLLFDEKILWSGHSEIEIQYKRNILEVISNIIILSITWVMYRFNIIDFKLVKILIIVFIIWTLSLAFKLIKSKVKYRKLLYGITNKRVVSMNSKTGEYEYCFIDNIKNISTSYLNNDGNIILHLRDEKKVMILQSILDRKTPYSIICDLINTKNLTSNDEYQYSLLGDLLMEGESVDWHSESGTRMIKLKYDMMDIVSLTFLLIIWLISKVESGQSEIMSTIGEGIIIGLFYIVSIFRRGFSTKDGIKRIYDKSLIITNKRVLEITDNFNILWAFDLNLLEEVTMKNNRDYGTIECRIKDEKKSFIINYLVEYEAPYNLLKNMKYSINKEANTL